MGQISLQIPQTGQPNSTEDPKIASDFTTLQTAINGNLDDTNLYSPNNGVRRLLLQAGSVITGGATSGDYICGIAGATPSGFSASTSASPPIVPVPFWVPDSGLSSQPQDFQVANKTAYCRVRASAQCNSTAPGVTITFGLYQLTGLGGGAAAISYTFGAAMGGSTAALAGLAGVASAGVESGQFAMPTTAPTSPYALGFNLGGTVAANCVVAVTVQLYGYNA